MSKEDGGPAFPSPYLDQPIEGKPPFDGMSLRDWFAGQALMGVMDVCRGDPCELHETAPAMFARKAYEMADAMILERNRHD